MQLLHYILKCNYFGMTTVSFFVKIISIPDEELFSETYVRCTAFSLSKCSLWFCNPPSLLRQWICYICGRRRVAVARYRMICLVFDTEVDRTAIGFHGEFATGVYAACQLRKIILSFRTSFFVHFWVFYHLTCLCNDLYCLSDLVGCWSYVFKGRNIYIL